MPYEPMAIWLVDQWRQIGLQARHEFIESTKWEADLRDGNYEVAVDTQCSYAVDPDLDLYKFQSMGISGNNYGRYVDKPLDDLYQKQSRALDAEERRKYVRDFERRLLDEEAHYFYTLQWHRIIPHSAKLRGWTVTPSHFVNNQLDGVWLAE
jgi:peptide/nickel transport system substrate-binding protein